MIQLVSGKQLAMVDGFTFHKTNSFRKSGGVRWRCSYKMKGCRAYCILDEEGSYLLHFYNHHCHEQPIFREIDGSHYKVN